jgi:hypothetical protein
MEASLMDPHPKDQKWYSLAEQASKEMDGAQLTIIVAQLCSALDESQKTPLSAAPIKLQ